MQYMHVCPRLFARKHTDFADWSAHAYVCIYIYIYIYTYIYNRHLGLINAPPLFLLFLQTTFFTIHILSKRPEVYKILAKTLFIRREMPAVHLGGHLGGHLGDHPFSLKTRPLKK